MIQSKKMSASFVEKVQTALFSIGTAAVVGCCTFLFKTTASLARIEQTLSNEVVIRNQEQAKVSNLQVDVANLKITTAEIKTQQNLKPR